MTVLTESERLLFTQRLADAQTAYHTLMTGKQARVFVDQNGERVEYATSNAERLKAYIVTLENLLGTTRAPGPMNVWML